MDSNVLAAQLTPCLITGGGYPPQAREKGRCDSLSVYPDLMGPKLLSSVQEEGNVDGWRVVKVENFLSSENGPQQRGELERG